MCERARKRERDGVCHRVNERECVCACLRESKRDGEREVNKLTADIYEE